VIDAKAVKSVVEKFRTSVGRRTWRSIIRSSI